MTLILALLYLLAIVSVLLFVFFAWAKTWPKAPAVFTHKGVNKFSVNGREFFKPEFTYSYSVDEINYRSSAIFLGGGRSYPNEEKALSLWPGEKVDAFYCPLRPTFSYLLVDSRLFLGLPIISAVSAVLIIFIV